MARLCAGLLPRQTEPDVEFRIALGSQHAVVRHARQNRDLDSGRAVHAIPHCSKGWLVPGDLRLPRNWKAARTLAPTDYKEFGPRLGLAYSPSSRTDFSARFSADPGKTSIRAAYGIYYTATEDLTLFDIVADAPYGQFWVAPQHR